MGEVTDVRWECPGCAADNIAQLYGIFKEALREDGSMGALSNDKLPASAGLKWNPPCERCGEYQLVNPPEIYLKYPVINIKQSEEMSDG